MFDTCEDFNNVESVNRASKNNVCAKLIESMGSFDFQPAQWAYLNTQQKIPACCVGNRKYYENLHCYRGEFREEFEQSRKFAQMQLRDAENNLDDFLATTPDLDDSSWDYELFWLNREVERLQKSLRWANSMVNGCCITFSVAEKIIEYTFRDLWGRTRFEIAQPESLCMSLAI